MLDHTIYDGAMGIAMFLSDAGTTLGSDRFCRVAVSAARASLHRALGIKLDGTSGSLYTGSINRDGGLRIGQTNGDSGLIELATSPSTGWTHPLSTLIRTTCWGRAGFISGRAFLRVALRAHLYPGMPVASPTTYSQDLERSA